MKEIFKRKQNGITLIALVITIIVLLILAGVSIAMLVGENGLLYKTSEMKNQNIIGEEKEMLSLSYSGVKIQMDKEMTAENLQIELDKYAGEGNSEVIDNNDETFYIKFKETNNCYILDKGNVDITTAKITDKKIILTDSSSDNTFINPISQEDVDAITGKNNTEYEIIGIASNENGEFNEVAESDFGKLEIIKDGNNTNFKYSLKKFMQGDETFFVKYSIEGVEQKKQKLQIIQGDMVTYEEDFLGINYEGATITEENTNFSKGKAVKLECSDSSQGKVAFEFKGSAMEFCTVVKKEEQATPLFKVFDSEGNRKKTITKIYDIKEEVEYNVKNPYIKMENNDMWTINIDMVKSRDYTTDSEIPPIIPSYLYIDAIVVYK